MSERHAGIAVTLVVNGGGAAAARAARGLAEWLRQSAPVRSGAVSLAVVTDARMRQLNKEFRGKDAVTDVLSFPNTPSGSRRPSDGFWGDVAISAGAAARQAREQGHALSVELRVLALHGLLHLLGYDHEVDDGDMRRVEERLRRRAGLPAGLVARSAPKPGARKARR